MRHRGSLLINEVNNKCASDHKPARVAHKAPDGRLTHKAAVSLELVVADAIINLNLLNQPLLNGNLK